MKTYATCPPWCTDHLVEEDTDGSVTEIHRGKVTRGGIAVELEESPSWDETDLPIVCDGYTSVDAAGARQFAAALLEAARLIEQKSPAELQLDEGHGNYMGAGAGAEPTGGGRAE